MNQDFHYYVTYYLCRHAGFSHRDSFVISYADQFTDDNWRRYKVHVKEGLFFHNSISYTKKIFDLNQELYVMMPLHFIPGDINCRSARRKDGKKSPLNVTAGGPSARRLLERTLATNNLYKIGIMLHAFQDTWAHQNFTGIWDDWNAVLGKIHIPNIGHAELGEIPDMFNAFWRDKRLVPRHEHVDNNLRFFECAKTVLHILCRRNAVSFTPAWKKARKGIGSAVQGSLPEEEEMRCEGIRRVYREEFFQPMPRYDRKEWLFEAVARKGFRLIAKKGFRESHWYRFQKHVKEMKLSILCYFYQKK